MKPIETKIKKPVIIIGCPRSGTSLLFTILSESEHLHSLYRESQDIFDSFYTKKKVSLKEYYDDALAEKDLDDEYRRFMLDEFHRYSLNNRPVGYVVREHCLKKKILNPLGWAITKANAVIKDTFLKEYRLVEKTPRNCFRLPFINKLFPDAKYIYLKRDGRTNISSLIEGWRRKMPYKRIPDANLPLNIKGIDGKKWRYVLPPNWKNYIDKPVEDVAAFQWISSNRAAIDGLREIPQDRVHSISYEDLTSNSEETIKALCEFMEIPYTKNLSKFAVKPPVVSTPKGDNPRKNKWLKNKELLENVYPTIEPMMRELGYNLDDSKELAPAS